MSYIAFYRKLRPKIFNDVIGQGHIIRTLKNQITEDRISHAYLFCGTRGTGKTSTAKIFARAVNCKNSSDANPCNCCESCESIERQISMDVIEIDAASNNSVEDVRNLRDEVKYPPVYGKYKVYIIDEVHMLSISAFNALLKTLEEPPAHVIFILATTDPQKIPVTIHSRCQRFDFKRISVKDMTTAIAGYMADEGVSISPDALGYIARISDGAMRDALSLLDRCTSMYYGEEITLEKTLNIVGSVDNAIFISFTEYLRSSQTEELMRLIDDIVLNGRDISRFVSDATVHFRNLLIAKTTSGMSDIFDLSPENVEALKTQAADLSRNVLITYIKTFSEMQNDLKYAGNDRILFEVTCIKLCNPVSGDDPAPLPKAAPATPKPKKSPPPSKAVPKEIKEVIGKWGSFKESFDAAEKAFLSATEAKYLDNSVLSIVCDNGAIMERLNKKEKETGFISFKLKQVFNREFDIRFTVKKDFDSQQKMLYNTDDFDVVQDKFTGVTIEMI